MRMQSAFLLVIAGAVVTACAPSAYRDSQSPVAGYGNAVLQNSAVMIIDPQPATAANVELDLDGRKAGLGIERYRTGTVIPPEELRTSDVGDESGGSDSGGQ